MSLGNWVVQKLGNYLLKEITPPRGFLCDFSRICHEIRPADVLLIEGRNRISHMVQHITESPWSHSALYIGRIHDLEDPKIREYVQHHYKGSASEQLLVESVVGFGTIIAPVSKYREEHIRVCRPTGLSHIDAQNVITFSVKTIGREYDIRHFFDLGRFIFASLLIPRRWKSSLFSVDAGKVEQDICSTMIAKAFGSIKFPILPLIRINRSNRLEIIRRNPDLYAPCDFDYSPYFDIIKYPMLPVTGYSAYRHLPWHEELMSNDDQGIVTHHDNEE